MDKKIFLAYLVSAVFVIALFSFFDASKVIGTILTFDLFLFGLILFLYLLIFVSKAIIWKLIVDPFEKISLEKSFYSLNIGFFANLILPLRAGEFVRAYLLSKFTSLQKSVALSTVIVNRVIEVIFLLISFFIGLLALPTISAEITTLIYLISILFVFLILVFVFSQKIIFLAKKIRIERFIPKNFSHILKNLISGGAALRKKRSIF